jgi:hypothetical protein
MEIGERHFLLPPPGAGLLPCDILFQLTGKDKIRKPAE